MSDLIDRDALYHGMTMKRLELHEKGLSWNEFCRGFGFAMEFVKQAPSVESEPEEFEWCNGCKEYDQSEHCCHRWTQNIRRTVEELKAQYEHPAKVENVYEDYSSEGICFLTYADCGNCGTQVMLGDKFCSECGAKLDWGGNE